MFREKLLHQDCVVRCLICFLNNIVQDLHELMAREMPLTAGIAMRTFLLVTKLPVVGAFIRAFLLERNGFISFACKFQNDDPLFCPSMSMLEEQSSSHLHGGTVSSDTVPPSEVLAQGLRKGLVTAEKDSSNILKYYCMYKSGKTRPSDTVAEVLKAIDEHPEMNFLCQINREHILQQAQESDERYKQGLDISILDGILFAVKDEFDVEQYPGTTFGTNFLAEARESKGTIPGVSALMQCGAILVGKTTMHEVGLGTTGINPNQGTPRNPYDLECMTGGSSSGSASLVASGLVPFTIGADGGGSIRIPSSFCGVVGLKTTFNRISGSPSIGLCHSVGSLGPIAQKVTDAAIVYSVMANRYYTKEEKAMTLWMRPLEIPRLVGIDETLAGKKFGIYKNWVEHSDESVRQCFDSTVNLILSMGASTVSISLDNLNDCSMAHSITIGSEMMSALSPFYKDYWSRFNKETQLTLFSVESFTGSMYVSAQKTRESLNRSIHEAFSQCDFIITPTTPCTAPKIPPAANDHQGGGMSDLSLTIRLMRFCQLANMVGIPSISLPAGYYKGLPIGFQVMAPLCEEAKLLQCARVIESRLDFKPEPQMQLQQCGLQIN